MNSRRRGGVTGLIRRRRHRPGHGDRPKMSRAALVGSSRSAHHPVGRSCERKVERGAPALCVACHTMDGVVPVRHVARVGRAASRPWCFLDRSGPARGSVGGRAGRARRHSTQLHAAVDRHRRVGVGRLRRRGPGPWNRADHRVEAAAPRCSHGVIPAAARGDSLSGSCLQRAVTSLTSRFHVSHWRVRGESACLQ
jgi:hypothetical protein